MFERFTHGLAALRAAVYDAVATSLPLPDPYLATGSGSPDARLLNGRLGDGWWFTETISDDTQLDQTGSGPGHSHSSETDPAERDRLIALVDLARSGDSEAFGLLYDHYQVSVYRFIYYKVGSVTTAEDLTSETFFRALRSIQSFNWQGKDFGAWLMTIARNLTMDHFKAARTRLEQTEDDMSPHDSATEGPEGAVLASLTNEALLTELKKLPIDQQECLIMRFLQGLSIAETAEVLGRSEGAVKQLQLRAVRNLAKALPEDLR